MNAEASRRSRGVLITTAVVGGLVLLGTIGGAVVSGMFSTGDSETVTQRLTVDAQGVDELDITVGSSNFLVLFDGLGGADTALLEVTGGTREWTLERDGSTLQVDHARIFTFEWFGFGLRPEQQVVLRLPVGMRDQGLDADLDISSGSFHIDGEFRDLDIDVSSGSAEVGGSARSLEARLSSGFLGFELADVDAASIGVSSGRLRGEITGSAPDEVEVRVSSGSADLALPDASYAVSSRVSSGSFDNLLRTDPSSRRTVDVSVSSGGVTLRAGG